MRVLTGLSVTEYGLLGRDGLAHGVFLEVLGRGLPCLCASAEGLREEELECLRSTVLVSVRVRPRLDCGRVRTVFDEWGSGLALTTDGKRTAVFSSEAMSASSSVWSGRAVGRAGDEGADDDEPRILRQARSGRGVPSRSDEAVQPRASRVSLCAPSATVAGTIPR